MPDDGSKPSSDGATSTKPVGSAGAKPATPPPLASRPLATTSLKPSTPPPPTPTHAAAPAPATPITDGKLVLGKGVSLAGHVRDAASVMVEGTFSQATIEAGELIIGPAGRINGQAIVTSAEVRGHFDGELTVQDDLTVHETGSISGTIRYGEFQAARGARLEGDIRTIGSETPASSVTKEPQAQEPDVPPAPDAEPEKRSLGGMLRRK